MFLWKIRMAEDFDSFKNNNQQEDDSDSEPSLPLRLDLLDDSHTHNLDENRLGNQNSGPSASTSQSNDGQRREENPFSFKHFLRSDSSNSYQSKGARPKVYPENRSQSIDYSGYISESKQSKPVPEYSSALPDFVQDHLVMEQCYLGNNSANNYDLAVGNLPDFAPNKEAVANLDGDNRGELNHANKPVPLDLPFRPQSFPLDLPIAGSSNNGSRNNQTISEVGNSKSLPDFLADSAVCTQKGETLSAPHSPEAEAERLRHELDLTKRQFLDKTRLCECLSRELEIARNKEHEYTQNLAKALEQVENNLEKSNRRAVSAENTVLKLKQEVKSLTIQMNSLKLENSSLRGEEAAGGHVFYNSPNEVQNHRLANELRTAANTAEHSLRQLLSGVDNLRMMAASLENIHRIEENSDPFSHFDDDAGPAL